MLEKIILRNFQKHKKLTINFSETVTTLCGKSDAGKSSILRALRWIMTNKPNGASFISWGEKSAAAMLVVDGHKVLRKRGKENTYQLDDKIYKSFGNLVPDEIADLLSIDEDINIATQHSNPTWLFDSPGQVSKELNRIVNLSSIDDAMSRAANEVRKAKSVVEVSESRLKEARNKRDNLRWVKDFDVEIQALEEKASQIAASKNQSEELAALLTEMEEWGEKANRNVPDIAALESKVSSIIDLEKDIGCLWSLLNQIENEERTVEASRQRKEEAESELKEQMGNICPVCGGEYEQS